jgi:hypothetical protein
MMKKIAAIVFSVTLVLSVSSAALAAKPAEVRPSCAMVPWCVIMN